MNRWLIHAIQFTCLFTVVCLFHRRYQLHDLARQRDQYAAELSVALQANSEDRRAFDRALDECRARVESLESPPIHVKLHAGVGGIAAGKLAPGVGGVQ